MEWQGGRDTALWCRLVSRRHVFFSVHTAA
jgi:hypothetical protein